MGDFESESSSSDGENAGEVKNVTRLVMRPPGHSGKAKKGHLVFDASFEGGNLGRVDYVGELDYDLYVRPDVANLRHRVWFNFTVENVRADQRVVFTFVNFSKVLLLFHEGFTPVVKSTSRPKWVRIPSKCVFYYRCPEHANRYVLSIVFAFDREDDVYHFAFSYPYSYTRLQKYLESLESKKLPYLSREKIGETLHGRRLDMVTIQTHKEWLSEDPKDALEFDPLRRKGKKKKKIVVVGARIHPGETPSSYVCQGMINYLLSDSPVAQILRDHVNFKFIPMLNPDGVFVGNYRTCILGQDLNRCWQETSTHAYPTLAAVKAVTETLSSEQDEEIDMYLDLHAHTGQLGAFVYGNSYSDVYRCQRHALFPKHLSYCAPDFSLEHTAYNKDKGKSGTSRRFLSAFLNEKVNCYTLEVSFHGYEKPKGNSMGIHVYNEDEYLSLGESICHSLLDYYCATKYIPPEEVPQAVRESCCKGSRAKMTSAGNSRSPLRAPPLIKAADKKPMLATRTKNAKGKVVKAATGDVSKTPAHKAENKKN